MKLNIRTKLIGGFMVVIVLLLVVSAVSWNGLNTLNAATDHIVHEQLPEDEQLRDLEFQVAFQGELYFEYALTLEPEVLEEARSHTQIIRDEAMLLEEELAGEPEMLAQLRQFEMEYEEFYEELERVAAFYAAGDTVAGVNAIHIAVAEEEQLELELSELAHEVEQQMEASFVEAERAHAVAAQLILWVSGFAIVVGLALSFLLSRSISNSVRKMSLAGTDLAERVLPSLAEVIRTVAGGDLSKTHDLKVEPVEVKSKDELGDLGRSFNAMIQQIDKMGRSTDDMLTGLKQRALVAEAIAVGDLNIEFSADSERDELGNAFVQMVSSLRQRASVAEAIAVGDLNVKFTADSERDVLGNAFVKMVAGLKQSADLAEQIATGDLSVDTQNVSEQDVLGNAFAKMVNALKYGSANVAEAIAAGDLNVNATARHDNDALGKAFAKMVETLKEKAKVAEAIAEGDLNVEVSVESDADVLGKAFQMMVANLRERAEQAEAIADGDLSVVAKPKCERDVLGNAFARMVDNLRGLIHRVAGTAGELTNASGQLSGAAENAGHSTQAIAANSQSVAEGAAQQTENMEETVNSMSQLTSAIDQIAKGSQDQASAVEQAADIVNQVSRATDEVAKSAQSAADSARQANDLTPRNPAEKPCCDGMAWRITSGL